MVAGPVALPDLNALDPAALKVLILAQHRDLMAQHEALISRETEIENLKLLILKLRRMQFGPRSEKLERQIEQLELQLEDLEAAQAVSAPRHNGGQSDLAAVRVPSSRAARRPLPDHLPRETETYEPEQEACPECGGTLRKLGEDVSELLEFVPARFKVIRIVRPKLSCASCEHIVQAPAPSRPIDRGLAGPGLLAHVLVSKFSDHLPLYRQSEIYERSGLDLDRSTLADWVGQSSRLLAPLVDALAATSWLGANFTPTTRRCRYWHLELVKPRPAACGPMFATTVPRAIYLHRPCGLPTRRRPDFGITTSPDVGIVRFI